MSGVGRFLLGAGGVLGLSGGALLLTVMFAGPGALLVLVAAGLAVMAGVWELAVRLAAGGRPVAKGGRL